MKIFEHANATDVEIALELFRPYPTGMLVSMLIFILFLPSSFFERIFFTTLSTRRELIVLLLDVNVIPVPDVISTIDSAFV